MAKKPTVHYDDIEIVEIPDENPDPSYLEQEGLGFEDRVAEYRRGDFYFVGIKARVEVEVARTIQTFESPGLWGIESDSGQEYFDEVGAEEVDQLVDILREMNIRVVGAPK